MSTNCFITFEGGEGSGKSTQIRRLADHLRERGFTVVQTREPGGSPAAETIRTALLSGQFKELGGISEMMMFNAARAHHLAEVIRPALGRGHIVLCDRFADSTRAYQGATGDVPTELIDAVQTAVVGDTLPDVTFILDLTVDEGFSRVTGRGEAIDRFEGAGRDFHERLRKEYLAMIERGGRYQRIDASQSMDQVSTEIRAALIKRGLCQTSADMA